MATELENLVPEADVEVEGMRGPKGDKGDSYVLTEADKEEIARKVDKIIDSETDKTLSISGKPADAKAAGDEISDVKADLKKSYDSVVSATLKATPNSYILATDGSVAAYNGWMTTDFIYCENLDAIYVSVSPNSAYNAFYADKDIATFISAFTVTANSLVKVPSGAKYFRLSNTNTGINNSIVYGYARNEIIKIRGDIADIETDVDNLNAAVFEKLVTDNYIDNAKGFWSQGRWDNPGLSYVVHSQNIALDGFGTLYFGGYCYGTPFTQNSAIVLRIMDSGDNLLHSTASKTITADWSISSINLDSYPTAHHIIIDFTTNSASVLVNSASFAANYRLYVGKSNIDSASGYYNKYE